MVDNNSNRNNSIATKTYLVRVGVGTVCEAVRENYDYIMVEGPDSAVASEQAWKAHCPEAFEDANQGHWMTYSGRRAFQLNDDRDEIDANCIYWLENVTEVEHADARVLRKYLRRR